MDQVGAGAARLGVGVAVTRERGLLHRHLHPLNHQHRGVILRINQRPLIRRERHPRDLSRKQLALIARAIHAAIEAPVHGVAEFLQQGAGEQLQVEHP